MSTFMDHIHRDVDAMSRSEDAALQEPAEHVEPPRPRGAVTPDHAALREPAPGIAVRSGVDASPGRDGFD